MEFKLHHIGMAVASLDDAGEAYARRFGYVKVSPVFEDPAQKARVQFWRLGTADHLLEFVSPLDDASHLNNAISQGRQLNHLCYAVSDLAAACAHLRQEKLFPIGKPVEAVAFAPRRIAWFLGKDGVPIELVEAGEDHWTVA